MKAREWIGVPEAWAAIEAAIAPLGTEEVAVESAAGRVLRAAVQADRDVPPFARSAMDGFAVHAADVRHATEDAQVDLRVIGESTPGLPFSGEVPPGSAVRIMTGAPLPADCDCVVPVEESSGFETPRVAIRAAAAPGKNVTPRGRERRAGDEILPPGRRLDAAGIGALALVGRARVTVGRRGRVAILSTGNELVALGGTVGPWQIRNSNGPMLAALAAPFAAATVALGIAGDTLDAIEAALHRGLESELLLVTGGVSMGVYDLVGAALERCGVRTHFERLALQPGKPTVFGTHPGGAVLALPGNPVSALTTFRLFGALALRRLEGESDSRPRWLECPAGFSWERRHAKWLFLPGVRIPSGGRVALAPYAGSGDLLAYAQADCQVVLPPDRKRVEPGEPVWVWPL